MGVPINRQPRKGIKGFQKGMSGNPEGRPKNAKMIPEILREIGSRPVSPWLLVQLHQKYGPEHNPRTMREAMLMAAMADAAMGDKQAVQFIADRTEGRVTEQLEIKDTTPHKVVFAEVKVRTIPRSE